MQSHRDDDSQKEALAALQALAERMTERRENEITAGRAGETALEEYEHDGVTVRRLPDDPNCLRISIGGGNLLVNTAYCVYRGDKQQIIELVDRARAALAASEVDND